MNVEQSVEWELVGETEVLGSKPSPVPAWPDMGSNPGRRGWEAGEWPPELWHGLYIGYS
jgi:hypothetical protein